MELFETVRRQLCEAQDEVVALRAAVQLHHDQRGDNRCHLDDMKLYHDVLGEGVDPYAGALPPDADMEESCRRYIRQRRCPGPDGVVPLPGGMTIQQLTDEVVALRAENERLRADDTAKDAEIAKLTARCNRMCCSAKIEDIHPGMLPQPEEGLSVVRLGELKRLAYHSKSLDDMGDAVIELIEEVRRLQR